MIDSLVDHDRFAVITFGSVLDRPPQTSGFVAASNRQRWQTLEWLGQIDSLFNEPAYLLANPDVGDAVAKGQLLSGWDHYLMFGQREGDRTCAVSKHH